jgi:hypothetical protein
MLLFIKVKGIDQSDWNTTAIGVHY